MPTERLVRTDNLGLVIPPSDLSCVGQSCPYEGGASCFPSGHHLYFEEDRFESHSLLAKEFRDDPHNKVAMARCQEDRIHSRFDGARVPSDFIMDRFLQESAVLQDLGVLASRVLGCERAYMRHAERAEQIDLLERPDVSVQYWEKAERAIMAGGAFANGRNCAFQQAVGIEVIPASLLAIKGYDSLVY